MRARKKLCEKTEWYRQKKKADTNDTSKDMGEGTAKINHPPTHPPPKRNKSIRGARPPLGVSSLKTKTVLFVEQTRGGELAKVLREDVGRLENLLGFRLKIVERTGMSLRNLLPNTNPWGGAHCSRDDCRPCNQPGEEVADCTRRSLVYESICLDCNPDGTKKGEVKDARRDIPSVYVGETARSLYERGREHWEDWKKKSTDSHILKHWTIHHQGLGEPNFILKVVGFHRTALSRQVGEAVRIVGRGVVLNSKGEFNRCKISRLRLEEEEGGEYKEGGRGEKWGRGEKRGRGEGYWRERMCKNVEKER